MLENKPGYDGATRKRIIPIIFCHLMRKLIVPAAISILTGVTKVKNVILMATVAKNFGDAIYSQIVFLPLEYATRVLDKNHT